MLEAVRLRSENAEARAAVDSCCAPPAELDLATVAGPRDPLPNMPDEASEPLDYVQLSGGNFSMGDSGGYATDGEGEAHPVFVSPFAVTATTVTNAQFADFVEATGYCTDAERAGSSPVFQLAVRADPADRVRPVPGATWWIEVRGASWAHPAGPLSSWRDVAQHPVVHVSWHDAEAFCTWAHARLPTEAEWEFAARGGHHRRRFPWGDELELGGRHRCNVWQGTFPTRNTLADGFLTTAPVRTYRPNDYGLYQVYGNVWEWCADWFSETYYASSPVRDPAGPEGGSRRVIRGGSYLCHHSLCSRTRLAARCSNTPASSAGNVGFRVVRG